MDDRTLQHAVQQLADALLTSNQAGVLATFAPMLAAPNTAAYLRALDDVRLLTRLVPELEPARATSQPGAHFLPVLAHSLETVAAVDWLWYELQEKASDQQSPVTSEQAAPSPLPVAVQTHLDLRFRSAYAPQLCEHMAGSVDNVWPRVALFKLAALLHDNAKPQTKQRQPDGKTSFYEHQVIGAQVAEAVAARLGFSEPAVRYIALVVGAHMRPGQLGSDGNVTPRALRRFFNDTGDAGPDVLLHALADHLATRGPALDVVGWYTHLRWNDALLDELWGVEIPMTPPLLNGKDIMAEFGIAPGPLIGQILAAVGEAQAGGDITTREEALAVARRALRDAGGGKREAGNAKWDA